jgi:transposase
MESTSWSRKQSSPKSGLIWVAGKQKPTSLRGWDCAPDNRITGNKVVGRGTRHVVNRAATALRMAANALLRSQTYLGAQYRRLRTKLGAPKAITAMAHRLARLVYRMLKYGQRYVDKGADYYEQKYRNQQLQSLRKKATQLGFH